VEHLELKPAFWRDKRVFVTGHTGLKGSWLSLWLQSLGASVIGYSSGVPTQPSLFRDARVGEGMVSLEGDVRDLSSTNAAIAHARPDIVIHMAAQSLVRHSHRAPVETYATNVMGTVNVLEAIRSCDSVRAAVNVTSDKCYENREWLWGYRENEPMGGHDPYSSSKGCSELVTTAYRKSFFSEEGSTALASARAGNVIGGGDWAESRLVPDVMRAAFDGGQVLIRNPDAIRPWQHVLNPLSGYLLLCERLWESREFADCWNFGPDEADARTVRWVLDRLQDAWGEEIAWEQDDRGAPQEARHLKVDSSKARMLLGWKPQWGLPDALERVASWYRAMHAGDDLREHTLAEILAFQTTAGKNMAARVT